MSEDVPTVFTGKGTSANSRHARAFREWETQWIHPRLRAVPENWRRAQLVLLVSAIGLVAGAIFIVDSLSDADATRRFISLVSVLCVLLGICLALAAIRFWGSLRVATHTICGAIYLACLIGCLLTNEPANAFFMVIVPVIALFFAARDGVAWIPLSVSGLVAIVLARTLFPNHSAPPLQPPAHVAFDAAVLCGVLTAIAWGYESTRARMDRGIRLASERMQLVLDHVDEGFLVVEEDGNLGRQQSAILRKWFGPVTPGQAWWTYLGAMEPVQSSMQLGWEALLEDVMPIELTLAQLPTRFERGNHIYDIKYSPIYVDNVARKLVLVVTDATAKIEAERAERAQREHAETLEIALADRAGFRDFYREGASLVRAIVDNKPNMLRNLHTLKGNSSFFRAMSVSNYCHELETRLIEAPEEVDDHAKERLAALWKNFASRMKVLVGDEERDLVVPTLDYEAVLAAVRLKRSNDEIGRMLVGWRHETLRERFGRISRQAKALANRMGKNDIEITISDGGLRLNSDRWSSFWASFVHVVTNAVDHGLEFSATRLKAGKSPNGTISLSATRDSTGIVIRVSDDGRGINWDAVKQKCEELDMPSENRADLEEALFEEGLSTRGEVTDVSGRGAGLGAVRAATVALGGTIVLDSEPGKGTTFTFRFPPDR